MTLERDLAVLAAEVEWPETPAFELEDLPERARAPRRWRRWLAGGGLVVAVAVAVPPVRAELEDLLGIAGGVRVERGEPGLRPPPAPLELGRSVTLAQARRAVGFRVALAPGLGTPDDVRLAGGSVSLLYQDTVLTQSRDVGLTGAAKQLGATTPLRFAPAVGGIWIGRGPRVIVLPDGRRRRAVLPGAGVLLWEADGIAYRLETRRGYAAAVRTATALRAGTR